MRGVFITGTDTGVGKTVVAAAALRYLGGHVRAAPMKPVQTGAVRAAGRLRAPDLDVCLEAAGLAPGEEELRLMNPYAYEPACSPHLAGRLSGRHPQISHIVECARSLLSDYEALVVEGAGGVLVPLDESHTMLDLMKAMGMPVVLVARAGLGTINHCLLSLEALRCAGLEALGVLFNRTAHGAEDFISRDNPAAVERFGRVPVLGDIAYEPGLAGGRAESWRRFEEAFWGLPRILEAIREDD